MWRLLVTVKDKALGMTAAGALDDSYGPQVISL
jgi:hypothetical protein